MFQAPAESERIPFAFIKAVVAHIYLEWIHPFGDGNGRLGRLAEFVILINSGVPAPAAHLLSQFYKQTRTEYYRRLAEASDNGGDLRPFLLYAAQGFVDALAGQIKHLHRQAELLMWRAVVDEAFQNKQTPASHRQRMVAIELANHHDWPRAQLRQLSPAFAEAYAGRTSKTLTRDINRLQELAFVEIRGTKMRARIEAVRGMRPFRVEP
jgi:Fic family protein